MAIGGHDIRHRYIDDVNGLNMHLLEAGESQNPCIVLLHGFPDLAFGWRDVMPRLAAAGFYVVAPDQRGYGETSGWSATFAGDLRPFGMQNLAKDIICLILKLKVGKLHCLVGHDFGSPVAAYTALLREDLTERLVLMSAPFPGAPKPELNEFDLNVGLGELDPPRQHYQAYNSGPDANADILNCPQGIHDFLRAYFHMKSADWPHNHPEPIKQWRAKDLSVMPHYYIMPADKNMPEVVAEHMPDKVPAWLSDAELRVFTNAFTKTEFQGAINWYRASSDPELRAELGMLFAKQIMPPTWYLAGAADWGSYQTPGALERMQTMACHDYRDTIFVPNAGHWVQQEQGTVTARHLIEICKSS